MHGRLLRHRLGRRPPRHRPGRPGREPAGPPPHQRRRGRARGGCWACSPNTATPPDDPIPVAIETPRGLLVACLRATGRKVYPINPMAVARYRDRHTVSGGKSDAGDSVSAGQRAAHRHARFHRPLPADTELAQAIAVLARAQQRRRSGTASPRTTSSAPTCASTSPASCTRSPAPAAASCDPRPGPSWPPPQPPPTPPDSPQPSSGRC